MVGLLLVVGLALANPTPVLANSKYAAVVVNAYTGKVLFARNADAQRYPASLTKMMTLYMLFEALERGDLTLNTEMTVSARAAGQAPSKIGLKAGAKIRVEDAIKALVVKSANDIATVVSEHLGGTEVKFAQMMTARARQLGMMSTRFANASGLPNSNQITSARDMATLGRRLIEDFPQYYPYFGTTTFSYKGQTYKGHNEVLKKYSGADGIKTGYIRASGFNLVTSVRRNGYHLIGVVLGGLSTKSRDAHMMEILDEQFVRIAADPSLGRRYAYIPNPQPKPGTSGPMIAIAPRNAEDTLMSTASAGMYPDLELLAQGDASYADEKAVQNDPIASLIGSTTVADLQTIALYAPESSSGQNTSDKQVKREVLAAPGSTSNSIERRIQDEKAFYGVQIGAYGMQDVAKQRLATAVERAPQLLQDVVLAVVPIDVDDRTIYRARIGPYRERDADATCRELLKQGITCFTVVQDKWVQ